MSASAATNLENAQHSTGPVTPEGKERVKFNALKTGIYARSIVLPTEEQSAYDALGAFLIDHWEPRNDNERDLVLTIQNATWRLNRIMQIEASAYAVATQQQLESINEKFPDQPPSERYLLARGAAYLANSRAFDQLSKQEGRLQRTLDRTRRELDALVASHQPEPPATTPQAIAAPPAAAPAQNQNGFVPRKFPKHMPAFTGPNAKAHRRIWLIKHGYENLV